MNFICFKIWFKIYSKKGGYCDKLMKAAYFVNLMQDFFGKLSAGNKKV